ncbi:hypothetical protein [Cohnella silvisoli]|uniref:DUF4261 domain-containing protein n=1 Tax=Cohnella silvisoli TaxID=2873699 RepID=A0ABV1KMJ3_9BACL|nr:hypothetical protein [Cohnella silvisoli]MCD9020498.1 hypothetical protein [Cohnella silvisoli]
MRRGIHQRLVQEIPAIGGRVVEAHESFSTLEKPYVLLVQGAVTDESRWTGFRTQFEVWPYVAQTEFADVDELTELILLALDGQVITDPDTNEVFTCEYQGTVGADKVDPDRNGLTRGLLFSVIAAQPVAQAETVEEDKWLVALSNWTSSLLGNGWHVYRERWPLNYLCPSVLWRLEGVEALEGNRAGFEARKRFAGHVIGRTLNEQTLVVNQLVEGLNASIKIPLEIANRRYLTVLNPVVDLKGDAMLDGQISITLSRRNQRLTENSPTMRKIHFHPNL